MKTFYYFWTLVVVALLIGSCDREPSCSVDYDFDFHYDVNVGTVANLGDTIWYTMDVRDPVLNNSTGDVVNLKPFDLYFKFRIGRLDTLYANYDDSYFDVIVEEGWVEQRNNPEYGTFWGFTDQESKFFKIGLVTKSRGLFRSELRFPYVYKLKEQNSFWTGDRTTQS